MTTIENRAIVAETSFPHMGAHLEANPTRRLVEGSRCIVAQDLATATVVLMISRREVHIPPVEGTALV